MAKKWIQKAVNPKHKGYCTPMSKSTCTPRRKALAKRFKKGGDLHNEDYPSIDALEILAVSDPVTFEGLLYDAGLQIEGRMDDDPLNKNVQCESISAIASEITEDIHDFVDINPIVLEYKKLAEDYGYIVSFLDESKLTYKQRKALPSSSFVEPEKRKYPIEDKPHARNALSRVSQFGSPSEKRKVRSAVHSKYPDIGDNED